MTAFFSRHSGWLWFAAFLCALFPIHALQLELFAAALVFMFAWACLSLSQTMVQGWNLPRTAVVIFAGLFWLLVLCSVFWSQIKGVSLIGFTFFSVMPLTFFVGVMAGNETFFKRVAYALAPVFSLMSLWAMVQFFFLNTYFNGQASHPLGDPSSLGALFSLALFCALGWILSARPKREHICAVILATLLVCGILATAARGPVFAFLPGIVLFSILLWPQIKVQRKSLLIVALGGLACYGLMQTDIHKRYDIGARLLGTVTMKMEDVSNNRIEIWSATVDMIKEKPLLGRGIGTYFLYYPEFRRATDINGATMAHNDPMQFWVELGMLGPLLFYAFAVAAVLRSSDALKRLGQDRVRERILTATIFSALGSMVVQSHVGFNHYNISILMLSGLLLAVWFRATGRALGEAPRLIEMPPSVPASVNKAFLALPFLMTGWLVLSLLAGDYFVNRARDNLFKEEMFSLADNINNANNVSHGLNFRAYLLAVNVPMSILEYNKTMLDEGQKKKLYDQVKGYMDSVLALNPQVGSAYYYLGRVQQLVPASMIPKGTPSQEEYFRKALKLEPLHIGARMELLKLAKNRGASVKEQLAILEPGLNFIYTVETVKPYYEEVARLYLEDKNYGKAKAVMLKMYEFQKRSNQSYIRQNTSIPQAIVGGDEIFKTMP